MQWDRHLRVLLRLMNETPAERTRREVQEIAEVLLPEKPPGTQIRDVWEEALSVHRVRFETEIVTQDDEPGRANGSAE